MNVSQMNGALLEAHAAVEEWKAKAIVNFYAPIFRLNRAMLATELNRNPRLRTTIEQLAPGALGTILKEVENATLSNRRS